ncbi:MAG: hypothetical protein U0353_08355 [Sandaracinus sp.]
MRARTLVAGLAIAGLAVASPSRAQLALVGDAVQSPPPAGVGAVRWPDVAYDPDADLYLAISGSVHVAGRFVSADGTPRDASFVLDAASAYAQAPRVAHVAGAGFLVAWHESVEGATELRGRVVRADGSFATGDLVLSPRGTNWEMGAALASSPASHVALVAWQSIPERQIVAQRIDVSASALGQRLGEPIVVDPRAIYFRDPAVVHHGPSDRFVIAYADCVADGACAVHAQRIDASSGARVGEPILLEDGVDAGYVPELAMIAHTGQVLAIWYVRTGFSAAFHARTLDGEGALGPLREVGMLGSYDANGVAYAPRSGTVLFVTHGAGAQDVAIELDATGAPMGAPVDFGPAGSTGNFNPRVVASTREARWLAVTSTQFSAITTQVLATASRDPSLASDAGASDDAGPSGDAGPIDAGSFDAGPLDPARDAGASGDAGHGRGSASGCGCRLGASPGSVRATWISIALLALGVGLRAARARRARRAPDPRGDDRRRDRPRSPRGHRRAA